MSWNPRLNKERVWVRGFLHLWNALLCAILGAVLLGAAVGAVPERPEAAYVVIGILLLCPYLVASWRSGRRTLPLWRHVAHAALGLGVVLALGSLPLLSTAESEGWMFPIILGSLCLVSWLSDSHRPGRRPAPALSENISH